MRVKMIVVESTCGGFLLCCTNLHMHAHSSLSLHVWLSSSSSRQTEGGEGRRELARREKGALISDGLTGCVDRAVAQEEEERCNGRTSRRKNRSKIIEEQTARDLEGGMRDQ
ncbi:hypothetical protein CesoFtcFv8_018494 [Champsocephalus esox]|uniref:Uncharacterized protein n=1 Tax=Champsocephalus esox TaxID=159716 RepID=A0AAN8BGB9_9TELE|nr:hypothetical protein CesoFtcFv8_018494 [Champsocephalus esox]